MGKTQTQAFELGQYFVHKSAGEGKTGGFQGFRAHA